MDYQELIERMRKAVISPFDLGPVADAIESLLAENERLNAECYEWEANSKQWEQEYYKKDTELAKYRDAPVKPRFECWSTNDGDSWYEHPADAELIYDVLGNNAKVGDEFEVMAGWCNVQARYRIVSEKDDDFEVECISHDFDNIPLIVKPDENK